jgi:hypothetical protein
MAEVNCLEHLVGDALDHGLRHALRIVDELVQNGAVAVLEHKVQLLLPSCLEHFD